MALSLIAICPEDAKGIVCLELQNLGATQVKPSYMAVHFEADEELYYRCHLRLSTVSQILRVLRVCSAKTDKMLYSQARRINWPEVFERNKTYRVDAVAGDRGPEHMSSNEISKQVRLAIEEVFTFKTGDKPKVDIKEPKLIINAFIREGRAHISVNTSGKALHKRGYRTTSHPAPIKETLAATLLLQAAYDGSQTLVDPMCGSGTIAIEATMMALNKACNIHRRKGEFAFEHLKDFNSALWRRIQDEERLKKKEAPEKGIYASDISQKYVEHAKENALRARVEKHITFSKKSFFESEAPDEKGIIVTNLPYGERIETEEEVKEFYAEVGSTLKKKYSGWKACLLVHEDSPWKSIGLKPSRKVPLLNGGIKTKFLIFDLYAGSKRQK